MEKVIYFFFVVNLPLRMFSDDSVESGEGGGVCF